MFSSLLISLVSKSVEVKTKIPILVGKKKQLNSESFKFYLQQVIQSMGTSMGSNSLRTFPKHEIKMAKTMFN